MTPAQTRLDHPCNSTSGRCHMSIYVRAFGDALPPSSSAQSRRSVRPSSTSRSTTEASGTSTRTGYRARVLCGLGGALRRLSRGGPRDVGRDLPDGSRTPSSRRSGTRRGATIGRRTRTALGRAFREAGADRFGCWRQRPNRWFDGSHEHDQWSGRTRHVRRVRRAGRSATAVGRSNVTDAVTPAPAGWGQAGDRTHRPRRDRPTRPPERRPTSRRSFRGCRRRSRSR